VGNPSAWISADQAPPPTNVGTATTAPPTANSTLDWAFSVASVDGYDFTRFAFSAQSQQARITASGDGSFAGFVTMYSPGQTPKALQLSGNGEHVLVNGQDATFLPGTRPDTVRAADNPDSWPRLLWHYRADAWAEVDGPFGFDTARHEYDNAAASTAERRIAVAVHFGDSDPITMPFAVDHAPSELVIATTESGAANCLGYDLAGRPQSGGATSTLTVCRIASDRVGDVSGDAGDRIAVHDVGDGTSIVCVLGADSLDLLDQSGLQDIADHAKTSPTIDDPSTWLPVR
jgi:hypothetical protein